MRIEANGIAIHYEIYGDQDDERRPWLIFGHSLACSIAM